MVALASSCSQDSPDRQPAAAPTTVATTAAPPPPSSTTSAVAKTAPGPARPTTTALASSPEGHAQTLYAAWTRGDRAAAAVVAQPQAVDALFARPWSGNDGWSFVECSGAAGSVICTWQGRTGQVLFRVQNVTGGVPVAVSDVRFQP